MRRLVPVLLLFAAACQPDPTADAVDAVRGELLDSPSARFRLVRSCPSGEGAYGLVDGVGQDGRRTGWRRFIFVAGDVAFGNERAEYRELRDRCAD